MGKFGSVEEILDFAIEREVEAHDFYVELAKQANDAKVREVLDEFAIEEMGHKIKLEAVKAGEFSMEAGEVESLDIADYVADIATGDDMSYADALVVAMKKEKAAYKLYLDLAAIAEAEELTEMFLQLAGEEAKHKVRFEIEYDREVLKGGLSIDD